MVVQRSTAVGDKRHSQSITCQSERESRSEVLVAPERPPSPAGTGRLHSCLVRFWFRTTGTGLGLHGPGQMGGGASVFKNKTDEMSLSIGKYFTINRFFFLRLQFQDKHFNFETSQV